MRRFDDDTGFNCHRAADGVDLDNPVHAFKRNDQLAFSCSGATGDTGPTSVDNDWLADRMAPLENLSHLRSRTRPQHCRRPWRLVNERVTTARGDFVTGQQCAAVKFACKLLDKIGRNCSPSFTFHHAVATADPLFCLLPITLRRLAGSPLPQSDRNRVQTAPATGLPQHADGDIPAAAFRRST